MLQKRKNSDVRALSYLRSFRRIQIREMSSSFFANSNARQMSARQMFDRNIDLYRIFIHISSRCTKMHEMHQL